MNYRIMATIVLAVGLCSFSGCKSAVKLERHSLLSSIRIDSEEAISIRLAQDVPFFMIGPDGTSEDVARIRKGQQFVLSDGYHVSIEYRFRGISDGDVILAEKVTSDMRSMGGGIKTESRVIALEPCDGAGTIVDSDST